jgi:hypothetical protein
MISLLAIPKWPRGIFKARVPGGGMKPPPLSSSELLAQVALALALCEDAPTPEFESEESGMCTM